MTFYLCKNNHSFTNLKICPSCFSKSKFRVCKTCFNLIGVWENHDCQPRIEKVIEVEKVKIKFETQNEYVCKEIRRIFGNCRYFKISFLPKEFYVVECGQRFYNVYSHGYGIDKIEQIVYHTIPYEEWKKEHDEYYFEHEGSNLYEFLKNRNFTFIYQTLRKVEINSLYEFAIGFPIFKDAKQQAENLIETNVKFVEYDSDFNYNLCKIFSFLIPKSNKEDTLLQSKKIKN